MSKYCIGVDVGGTKIAYGLFDENIKALDKLVSKTNPELNPEEMIDNMCKDMQSLLSRNSLSISDISGVGIAMPSHIEYEKGLVITTSNLPKWDNVPAKEMFTSKLNTRVQIDNDANVAAIAEHRMGAGKGYKDMLYITISTGIGGGIIINNQVFRGSYGSAGEFGHVIVREGGYLCGCGNRGCFQSIASGPKIEQYAKDQIKLGVKSSLQNVVDSLSCKDIELAAKHGDRFAMEIIQRTGETIGLLFANLYQVFNINLYVLGGGVTKFGEPLLNAAEKKFKSLCKFYSSYPVTIKRAELGDNVGIYGAAMLIFNN